MENCFVGDCENPSSSTDPMLQGSLCAEAAKLHVVLDIWEKLVKKMFLLETGRNVKELYSSTSAERISSFLLRGGYILGLNYWSKSWECGVLLIYTCGVSAKQNHCLWDLNQCSVILKSFHTGLTSRTFKWRVKFKWGIIMLSTSENPSCDLEAQGML